MTAISNMKNHTRQAPACCRNAHVTQPPAAGQPRHQRDWAIIYLSSAGADDGLGSIGAHPPAPTGPQRKARRHRHPRRLSTMGGSPSPSRPRMSPNSSLAARLTPRQRTLIILALSLGGFAIGTSEFASMGLMLEISRGLSISETQVGHLISAYAIGVVVGAPILAFVGASFPRRKLLLALMGFYAVGNLASALAPNYATMLLARFVAGLPHGAYFGVAMLVAAAISPAGQRGQAMSRVLLGLSIAILVGNPLTTWLGQQLSWRTAFALVSLLAIATVVMIARFLLPDPDEVRTSPMRELRAFNTTQVWLALAIGAVGFAGMFCVFTYLAPTLVQVTGVAESWMPLAVGVFGIGAIIGNIAGGWLVDKFHFKAAAVVRCGRSAR
ncbi:hypothetical protein G6F31_014012 [Rhizopus arrhizus]|nr:hypothetical protein G6F31_014012 [Rhizopus arrhizus]